VIAYVIAAIFDFLLAGFVLLHGKSRTAVAFSILSASAGVWTIELFFLTRISDLSLLEPLFHIFRLGLFLLAPFLIIFHTLITRTFVGTGLKVLIGCSLATSLLIYGLNVSIFPTQLYQVPVGYSARFDPIAAVYLVNFIVACGISALLTYNAYRKAIFKEKLRLKWLVIGVVIGGILGLISFKFPKLFIGTMGSVISLCFIAYSVIMHRPIGVRAGISNGAVKAISAFSLIALYLVVDSISIHFEMKNDGFVLVQIFVFLIMLEGYPRLVKYFTRLRGRLFDREYYNYDFVVQMTARALSSTLTPVAMKKLADQLFLRTTKVENYSLHLSPHFFPDSKGPDGMEGSEPCADDWRAYEYGDLQFTDHAKGEFDVPLRGKSSSLNGSGFLGFLQHQTETTFYDEVVPRYKRDFQNRGISAAVPIMVAGRAVGYVMLGRPLKEEQFSHDDIRLLNWFGGEVGGVLEKLIVHLRMENTLHEAEKTLSVVSQFNEYNHDVKTPFSNIEALISAGDVFTDEEREAKILEQVHRGSMLVSTMVNVLKGQHYKTKSLCDLNQLAEEAIASFPTQAKNVQRSFSPLPASYAYEEELKIVLLNLLTNAFHAKDKDSLQVQVSTHYDRTHRQVICKVADNGCGIAPERLEALWSRPGSSRKHLGGSGVGLAVIKRIIEEHDGTIAVVSTLGEGTEFTLTLPIADIQPASASQAAR